jgi:Lon protease-like protein
MAHGEERGRCGETHTEFTRCGIKKDGEKTDKPAEAVFRVGTERNIRRFAEEYLPGGD